MYFWQCEIEIARLLPYPSDVTLNREEMYTQRGQGDKTIRRLGHAIYKSSSEIDCTEEASNCPIALPVFESP